MVGRQVGGRYGILLLDWKLRRCPSHGFSKILLIAYSRVPSFDTTDLKDFLARVFFKVCKFDSCDFRQLFKVIW